MIAFDTNIFIYVLNGDSQFGPAASKLLKATQRPKMASELVFGEILASPKLQDISLQNKALLFLNALDIQWQKINRDVLFEAAGLRRQHPNLKLVDALHIASAIVGQAEIFFTNDQDLVHLKGVDLDIRSV
jgi:predicted nucleic acid-binding protein